MHTLLTTTLMLVVPATVVVALAVDIGALVAWLTLITITMKKERPGAEEPGPRTGRSSGIYPGANLDGRFNTRP